MPKRSRFEPLPFLLEASTYRFRQRRADTLACEIVGLAERRVNPITEAMDMT